MLLCIFNADEIGKRHAQYVKDATDQTLSHVIIWQISQALQAAFEVMRFGQQHSVTSG